MADATPRLAARVNGVTLQNVPRERLLEMAAAIRQALPRCVVDVF